MMGADGRRPRGARSTRGKLFIMALLILMRCRKSEMNCAPLTIYRNRALKIALIDGGKAVIVCGCVHACVCVGICFETKLFAT